MTAEAWPEPHCRNRSCVQSNRDPPHAPSHGIARLEAVLLVAPTPGKIAKARPSLGSGQSLTAEQGFSRGIFDWADRHRVHLRLKTGRCGDDRLRRVHAGPFRQCHTDYIIVERGKVPLQKDSSRPRGALELAVPSSRCGTLEFRSHRRRTEGNRLQSRPEFTTNGAGVVKSSWRLLDSVASPKSCNSAALHPGRGVARG